MATNHIQYQVISVMPRSIKCHTVYGINKSGISLVHEMRNLGVIIDSKLTMSAY